MQSFAARAVALLVFVTASMSAQAQTLTSAKLTAWLESYGAAWETRDPDKAAALFTENARYHEMPWRTNGAIRPPRSVWICPANPRRSNGRNLFHYCLNENVDGTGDFEVAAPKLGAIYQPSSLVWLFDTKNLPGVGGWFSISSKGGPFRQYLGASVAPSSSRLAKMGRPPPCSCFS